jgi:hypothetical protein
MRQPHGDLGRFMSGQLVQHDLHVQRAGHLSRSEAIRAALLGEVRRRSQSEALAAEMAALEADEADQVEMLAVAEMMEALRDPR